MVCFVFIHSNYTLIQLLSSLKEYIFVVPLMAKFIIVPKTRLELARILKSKDHNINEAVSDLWNLLDLDESNRVCLDSTLRRRRDTIRKAKEYWDSLDVIGGILKFLWSPYRQNYQFLFMILPKQWKDIQHTKNIDELSLKQQRLRLSSVLEAIDPPK